MIKEVNEENIFLAAEIYMISWKESHKEICSPEFIEKHDSEYMKNALYSRISEGFKIYMYFEESEAVGIVAINPEDEEISLLYVLPEKQSKGFGSRLLEFAVSKCRNPYVTVLDTNKKAIEFYKKRGFAEAGNQPENNPEKIIFERKYVYQSQNM